MRRLYVMRHAKSDWDTRAQDHDRPINARGVRSAEAMATVLDNAGEVPDLIVSSTATRARTTAELLAERAGWEVPIVLTKDLYMTSVGSTLEVIGREGIGADRLMIVGHQPTWANLIEFLTGGRVDVKTATVAALDTYSTWLTLAERSCSLAFVLRPRLFV